MRLIKKETSNNVVIELYDQQNGAPELYIDGIQGVGINGDCLKLNLFVALTPAESDIENKLEKRVIVQRLVLGLNTFAILVDSLPKIFAEMQKQGHVIVNNQPNDKKS